MERTLEVFALFITKSEPPSEAADIKYWELMTAGEKEKEEVTQRKSCNYLSKCCA